jgi:spore coat polysaccharide biosynthesis protein SpsF
MGATVIIQARMGSTRLPGKVLMPIAGHPMLWHVVKRAQSPPGVERVVVATTRSEADNVIREFCAESGFQVYSGSEDDVLDRYCQAARECDANPVVRITSDCPAVDPTIVQRLLELFDQGDFDYAGVSIGRGAQERGLRGYPHGLDAECFTFAVLEKAWREATNPYDREHVTPYISRHDNLYRIGILVPDQNWTHLRLTVDEPEDLALAREIYDELYEEEAPPFTFEQIVALLEARPELAEMNRSFIGREKYRAIRKEEAD